MRTFLFATIFLISISVHAQNKSFPDFLVGTWQRVDSNQFEHWDRLQAQHIKGVSYTKEGSGLIQISEYLTIEGKGKKMVLSALLPTYNQGNAYQFSLSHTEEQYTFENRKHDFPQTIQYKKINDDKVQITLAGQGVPSEKYLMNRVKVPRQATIRGNTSENANYNQELAKKLGADEYGMKNYFFVLLTSGTNTSTDAQLKRESFEKHMYNISQMVKNKQLVVAGPFGKNNLNYRGLFIVQNVHSIAEVQKLLKEDAAIQNQFLKVDIIPWYGSAAIAEYLPFSEQIWTKKP